MFKKHVLAKAGSSSSKATALLARGAYSPYVAQQKARTPLEAFFNIPNMKKGEVPENLPLTLSNKPCSWSPKLAFRILELSPGSFLAIFFSFFHPRISCQQTLLFKRVP